MQGGAGMGASETGRVVHAMPMTGEGNPVYTIGHSNVPLDKILSVLRQYGVTVLVDARSAPYSSYNHQFDREQLERDMPADIRYLYLGQQLGGRTEAGTADPDDPDVVRRVESGIQKLLRSRRRDVVCVMCAEEDPRECHRSRLIAARLLAEHGVDAQHIRHDGRVRVQPQSRLEAEQKQQLSLFG